MRVILADPYLTSFAGHSYSYFQLLFDPIKKRNCTIEIVGAKSGSKIFPESANITTIFSAYPTDPPLFGWRIFRTADQDFREFQARLRPGPDDHVVFNTLRYFHLKPVAKWLAAIPPGERPSVSIILHYSSIACGKAMRTAERGYRNGFRALRSIADESVVRIVADTQELVEELQKFSAIEISLAPIPPISTTDKSCDRAPIAVLPEHDLLCVAFAGEARQGKGFLLLDRVASAIKEISSTKRVHFRAQIHRHGGRSRAAQRIVQAILQNGFQVVDHPLTADEYADFIMSADVLILPYIAPAYRQQSSGVFIDALVSGKVTVVPRESWMGRIVESQGGGTTFSGISGNEVARALLCAIDKFDTLKTQANRNQIVAKEFHSAENLAQILLDGHKVARS